MKKIIVFFAVLLIGLMNVAAYDSQFEPNGEVALPPTGDTDVDYCVWSTTQHVTPVAGLPVILDEVCKDVDGNYGCQPADTSNPSDFTVTQHQSQTQANGCVDVTLTTDSASGDYYFTLNGEVESVSVTGETGHAFIIPEFSAIGGVLALFGAGLIYTKKKNK